MEKTFNVLEFDQHSENIPTQLLEGRIAGFVLTSSKTGGETPCLINDEISHLLAGDNKDVYAFKLPHPEYFKLGELFEDKIKQGNSKEGKTMEDTKEKTIAESLITLNDSVEKCFELSKDNAKRLNKLEAGAKNE